MVSPPKQVSLILYNNFALYFPSSVGTFRSPVSCVIGINVLSFLKSANLCFFSLPDSLPCAFTLTEYELVFWDNRLRIAMAFAST